MIAAVVGRRQLALGIAGAAELAAPDDERVVEHAPALQVRDQGGAGLIGLPALPLDALRQVVVLIPALVIELDERDAALGEPARQQTVGGERARRPRVRAVERQRLLRFVREVHHAGHAGLHAIRHLVLRDARVDLGIARPRRGVSRAARSADRGARGGSRGTRRRGWRGRAPASPPLRNCTPWCRDGRNPLPHSREYSGWSTLPGVIRTTNAGRSSVSLPRP